MRPRGNAGVGDSPYSVIVTGGNMYMLRIRLTRSQQTKKLSDLSMFRLSYVFSKFRLIRSKISLTKKGFCRGFFFFDIAEFLCLSYTSRGVVDNIML